MACDLETFLPVTMPLVSSITYEIYLKIILGLHDIRYVSLRLRVQNAVPAQPCVGKLGISLVLLNFLH